MIRDSADRYSPAAKVNEEQDIVRHQYSPGEHVHREEVVPASTSMCNRMNSLQVELCLRLGDGAIPYRLRILPTL